jgi:hypothetical protein
MTSLVISIEFAITPLRIMVAMAQSRRHLSTVPASLLALSDPIGGVCQLSL